MKRFYIVLVLFAAMVAVSARSLQYLYRVHTELIAKLDEAASAMDSPEIRDQALDELIAIWQQHVDVLHHYVRNSRLDEIELQLMRLPATSRRRQEDDLYVSLAAVRFQIIQMWENERLSVDTIF